MSERWTLVPGFPHYEISDSGRVRRVVGTRGTPAGHELKPAVSKRGYLRYRLYNGSNEWSAPSVHRLVLLAFVGPCPEGQEVNHKDGDKSNNALDNLEYVTPAVNHEHAVTNGLVAKGEKNGLAKLTAETVREIRDLAGRGASKRELANLFGVHRTRISQVLLGKAWGHVCQM